MLSTLSVKYLSNRSLRGIVKPLLLVFAGVSCSISAVVIMYDGTSFCSNFNPVRRKSFVPENEVLAYVVVKPWSIWSKRVINLWSADKHIHTDPFNRWKEK